MADEADSVPRETSIRIVRDTALMLTTVAHASGLSVAEYLDRTLRPILLQQYREHLEAERNKVRRELAGAK